MWFCEFYSMPGFYKFSILLGFIEQLDSQMIYLALVKKNVNVRLVGIKVFINWNSSLINLNVKTKTSQTYRMG